MMTLDALTKSAMTLSAGLRAAGADDSKRVLATIEIDAKTFRRATQDLEKMMRITKQAPFGFLDGPLEITVHGGNVVRFVAAP